MIRLRQLEALRAVMSTGSVTAAADVLGISQPAVSRLIASLEKSMAMPLFERHRGRLHPTHEAKFLSEEVERAISNLEHISRLSEDIRNQKAGHLRIACLPGFATSLMPKVIAEFLKEREDVTISIQTRSSVRVREWIAAQQYDIGVADEFEGHTAIQHETVNIRTECVLSPLHPLAAQKVIRPEDLHNMPMIIQDQENRFHHRLKRTFEAAGAELNARVEVRQFATACLLAMNDVGAAVVSSIDAAEYAGRGLIVRQFKPELPFTLDLLYPKYHPRSLLLQDFISHFKERLSPFIM
ncbi:LysR family transcriptional regulator [Sneathiella sp. P13V-1]|uniref:LysR substrate-binding domain-containing protein n=1 Tax=Sneathiella sp. P13V-1 TaxID=2697366 RepID=UPI00187B5B3E|nr:LysR substrate-binding domain-containing protein [Sneathiella sp. P13V-1]MBE7638196.1 LysR family transcriptional regulator [Sneathiella sp. P13V-1]